MNQKSLITILVGVVLVTSLGYFVWLKKTPDDISCGQVLTKAQNIKTGEVKTFNDSCIPDGWKRVTSQDDSQVTDESTTTAHFTGYYVLEKGVYGEENTGPNDCDSFVVHKSSDPLFRFLVGWSPRAVDSKGDLSLHVSLNSLDKNTKNKIITSNSNNPVSLTVQKIKFVGKGLPVCGSVVDILSVD